MKNRTRRHRLILRFAVIALALSTAGSAAAEVILGNIPATNDNIGLTLLGQQRRAAMSFSMPTGFQYVINSITLRLNTFDGMSTPIVQIRDHNAAGNSPGSSIIGSLSGSTVLGTTAANYVFVPTATITLQPSQSYWLYVHAVTDAGIFTVNWRGSVPPVTPTGIATFGTGRFSSDHGATWVPTTTITSFLIDGTTIPEPASLALVGFGAIAIMRRRPSQRAIS